MKDNRDAFLRAIESGATPRAALEATPAYRIRTKFGFHVLDEAKSKYDPADRANIYFEMVRGDEAAAQKSAVAAPASASAQAPAKATTAGKIQILGPTQAKSEACVPGYRVSRQGGDMTRDLQVNLEASGCAYMHTDSACLSVARAIVVPKQQSQSPALYFKDTCTGSTRLSATAAGYPDSTLTVIVR